MVVGSRGAARLRKVVGGSYVRPDDAAHAKSNDRQPTAQMLLEAIEAIDARDARIAELATALRDVLDLSDTRKRRETCRDQGNHRQGALHAGRAGSRGRVSDQAIVISSPKITGR